MSKCLPKHGNEDGRGIKWKKKTVICFGSIIMLKKNLSLEKGRFLCLVLAGEDAIGQCHTGVLCLDRASGIGFHHDLHSYPQVHREGGRSPNVLKGRRAVMY